MSFCFFSTDGVWTRRIAEHLLRESLSEGFTSDFLLCYDYSTLEPEPGFMREAGRYSRITIVAWSFGVWVAQHTELPPIERAIAINGTLHPVNEEQGISPQVFQATLSTWSEESRQRFNRRMCGTSEVRNHFSSMSPDRGASRSAGRAGAVAGALSCSGHKKLRSMEV